MKIPRPAMRRPDARMPSGMPVIPRAGSYSRLELKRPAVLRRANTVITCYLWEGTRQCLKDNCFWPRSGKCSILNRLLRNGNGKRR